MSLLRTSLVFVSLAAAAAATSVAFASPDPRSLALRLSDLPAGATLTSERSYSVAAWAKKRHLSPAAARALGFVSGFERMAVGGSLTKPLVLAVEISVYRSERGPARDVANGLALCHSNIGHELPFTVSLGDESHACRVDQAGYRTTLVFWRHGNVSATVGVTSSSHADQLPLASSLAQKQDARLA